MKHVKHLASLLLALVMALALTIPALAAPSDTCTVYFYDPFSGISTYATAGPEATERTYNGYKLMTLTTSLNCSESHEHSKTCYNYGYELNPKYTSILLTAAGAGVTDRDSLIQYLTNPTTDVQKFADTVYRAIQKNTTIEPDEKNLTANNPWDIAQGYWLFADITDVSTDTNTAKSLILLDTKGGSALTVTPKAEIPTVDKEVSDTDGSGYGDSTDVSIGDTVYFKITGTLPEHLDHYVSYKYVFHDTLSSGLTFKEGSVKVMIGTTDVTSSFTVKTTGLTDGCTLEVSCDNILADDFAGASVLTADSEIVLTYSATLNENAVIGKDGNDNKVHLEYTNDPYDDGTGKTPDDEVKVYSFKLDATKVDSADDSKKLEGAEFVLLNSDKSKVAKIDDGKFAGWVAVPTEGDYDEACILKSGSDGKFGVSGLDAGTYYLKEIKAPTGYNLMKDPIKIEIEATYDKTELKTLTITVDDGEAQDGLTSTGTVSINVENSTGTELPSTGGIGTTIFYVLGSALALGAAVLLVTRKRMRDQG